MGMATQNETAAIRHVRAFIARKLPDVPPAIMDEWSVRIVGSCFNAGATQSKIIASITDASTIDVLDNAESHTITIRNAPNVPVKTCGATVFKTPTENVEPRPVVLLREVMHKYPNLSVVVNSIYSVRGNRLPDWPDWCFIPTMAWNQVLTELHGHKIDDIVHSEIYAKLVACATWRYGQGIYRFDPVVFDAVADSQLSNTLPASVLMRLPEWSIYVEMPDFTCNDDERIFGFFAQLDVEDENDVTPILRLTIDFPLKHKKGEIGVIAFPIPLKEKPLTDIVDEIIQDNDGLTKLVNENDTMRQEVINTITPMLSLLLYICSDEPEIDNSRKPGTSPFRYVGKKTKGRTKLFPASNPQIWNVGTMMGQTLRKAGYVASTGHGKGKRAHLRRGHWHGYWHGSRKKDQIIRYKWLKPKMVGGGEAEVASNEAEKPED
jgi:hypothetical protein